MDQEIITYLWVGVPTVIIVTLIIIFIFIFGKRKKKNSGKICNHDFVDKGYFTLDNKYPRVFSTCMKCGVSVHRPIYSKKQFEESEEE